ncbi:MAG: Tad domain-containing protein [Planctomycetes bacterium]|nr:Tad domain-containing protein [Planctomycetota bacterium]
MRAIQSTPPAPTPTAPRPALASLPRAIAAEERSTVTIGFLMLSVALFLCVAAVWNTGSLVDRKIQAQAVADSAALTAASELASTMNDMVTQNMLEVRLQSAAIIQKTIRALKVLIPIQLIAAGAYAARYFFNPFTVPLGIYYEALVAHDAARFAKFVIAVNKAEKIENIQNGVKQRHPKLVGNFNQNVYNSMQKVEQFVKGSRHQFKIYVGHSSTGYYPQKSGDTSYLFTQPSYVTKLAVLAIRVLLLDQQWKTVDPWKVPEPTGSTLRDLPKLVGKFTNTDFMDGFKAKLPGVSMPTLLKIEWFAGMGIGTVANANATWSACVPKMDDDANNGRGREQYQIIACAVTPNDEDARRDNYMAPVFFDAIPPGKNIVAVAAAEVNNPNFDFFASIPVLGAIINFLPWRYWSSLGANYQARLTRVSPRVFAKVVERIPELQKAMADNGKGANYGNVFLH